MNTACKLWTSTIKRLLLQTDSSLRQPSGHGRRQSTTETATTPPCTTHAPMPFTNTMEARITSCRSPRALAVSSTPPSCTLLPRPAPQVGPSIPSSSRTTCSRLASPQPTNAYLKSPKPPFIRGSADFPIGLLTYCNTLLSSMNLYHFSRNLTVWSSLLAVPKMGCFRLVIAVSTTVVARARGAVRGDPRTMSSFQAEVYAFLAGVYLLGLLTKEVTANAKNEIHTDSLSLLSRLARALGPYVPLGFWTKLDSDIVRQITDEVQNIHELTRTYVKGHQDLAKDKTKYTNTHTIATNWKSWLGATCRRSLESLVDLYCHTYIYLKSPGQPNICQQVEIVKSFPA